MIKQKEYFLLGIIVTVYLFLSIPLLDLPGPHDEETFLVMNSASIVLNGKPFGELINVFGVNFPIMMHEHVGSLSTFTYLIPFYLFGVNVISMRLTRIFVGLICIILTYWFARLYFDKKTALITGSLIATLPFYIFFFRQGYLDDGFNMLFMLITLICFHYFYKLKKTSWLYISFFILGLGLSNKLNFLWFIIGLSVSFLIFRKEFQIRHLKKKHILIALLFFIIGALPIIYYNLAPGLKNEWNNNTIEEIFSRIIYPRYAGSNLDILDNLIYRIGQLVGILNNNFDNLIKINNPIYFILFIAVVISNIIFFKKRSLAFRFFTCLTLIIFFQSLFTITALRVEHYMISFPLIFSLFAFGLIDFPHLKKKIIWVFSIITIFNLLTLASTYNHLYSKGAILPQQYEGWHFPSDSIYGAVDFLDKNNINPIGIGSGLSTNIELLSNFKVSVKNCEYEPSFSACVDINKSNHYITKIHFLTYRWWKKIRNITEENNKSIIIKKVFYTRDKDPEILIFQVKDEKTKGDIDRIEMFYLTNRVD